MNPGPGFNQVLDVLRSEVITYRTDGSGKFEEVAATGEWATKVQTLHKELIEHIARQADISKAAATRALEAVIGGVKTTLKKGGSVSIVGFGTFAVTKRAARVGRNPRTKEPIKIKSAKVPKFRPGKGLKDAVN